MGNGVMSARPDKERDLLHGALRVFARDGYSRATVDVLAAAGGVSSRTIYNHHGGKAGLFRAVILDSATQVADLQIREVDRVLGDVSNMRESLEQFGLAWSTPDAAMAEHFAMVRHIEADRSHIDAQTLSDWLEAGPLRVRRAIAGHLQRLADSHMLKINNPEVAALQLVQLTAGCVANSAGSRMDRTTLVCSGVAVFLAAYGSAGCADPGTDSDRSVRQAAS